MNGALYRDEPKFVGSFTGSGYPWGPMQPGMYFSYPAANHATVTKACQNANERGTFKGKYFITVRHLWRCYCMEVH